MCALVILFISCGEKNKALEFSLIQSGKNRPELELVLEYYKNDSLKYKAACFLIENMREYYSYTGVDVDIYCRKIDSLLTTIPLRNVYEDSRIVCAKIDSFIQKYPMENLQKTRDIQIVTADFLINNIEQAFNLWYSKPWAKHLAFNDFCEYLLPYKLDDEFIL